LFPANHFPPILPTVQKCRFYGHFLSAIGAAAELRRQRCRSMPARHLSVANRLRYRGAMDDAARADFADFLAGIFDEAARRRAVIEARNPVLWRHRSGLVVDAARRRIVRTKP
jgi:hypothetical protein